ncbi:helix-turn-helix domain-containing protein [Niveibacterium sp.]|uniref:helix-turn-helix domain-containing protein n=1 Tax=Niveibacterium sp. TaxID=2017444 RepID=UPI0035B38C36
MNISIPANVNTIDCSSIVRAACPLWAFLRKLCMNLRQALGRAIRSVRRNRHLSQEAFDVVSSRTYMSTLERGLKSPTIDKLDEIASVMGVQSAALVCLAYALADANDPRGRLDQIAAEAHSLLDECRGSPD